MVWKQGCHFATWLCCKVAVFFLIFEKWSTGGGFSKKCMWELIKVVIGQIFTLYVKMYTDTQKWIKILYVRLWYYVKHNILWFEVEKAGLKRGFYIQNAQKLEKNIS